MTNRVQLSDAKRQDIARHVVGFVSDDYTRHGFHVSSAYEERLWELIYEATESVEIDGIAR